jgi:hypothetical protein
MPRKIEEQMVAAVRDRRDWTSGNTRVVVSQERADPICVHLHGSWIAQIGPDGELSIRLAGYNTAVTRNRVSALCREFGHSLGVSSIKRLGGPHLIYRDGSRRSINTQDWVGA